MESQSQSDIDRECSSLSGDDVKAAGELVAKRNPSLNVVIDDKRVAPKQASLGITPAEFKTEFNKVAKELRMKFAIGDITISSKGEVFDTFNVQFGENNGLIGAVTKDGMLSSVTSISTGDGSVESGARTMVLALMIVRSVIPNLEKDEASLITLDLIKKSTTSPNGIPYKQIVSGVKLWALLTERIGFFFGVETPKDDDVNEPG